MPRSITLEIPAGRTTQRSADFVMQQVSDALGQPWTAKVNSDGTIAIMLNGSTDGIKQNGQSLRHMIANATGCTVVEEIPF